MKKIQGKGVCRAIAMGALYFYRQETSTITRRTVRDPQQEQTRFAAAKDEALQQLQALYEKALREVGEVNAQIFEIHQMMLADEDYLGSVTNLIQTQSVNAEYAVSKTSDSFSQMFSTMEDDYMKGRAADVVDISNRILRCLTGQSSGAITSDQPVILVADDLTPSETVQLDASKILAFATQKGSENSHTAILARTMGIPAVVALGELDVADHGKPAIVDGFSGTLLIDPDEATIAEFQTRQAEEAEKARLRQALKGKPNVTLDGHSIELLANISTTADIGSVLEHDAGGIGLFRSEFLYLQNNHFPTEEEQFYAYREVAEKMGGKPVTIRTMDIGADKKIDYFHLPEEENPAMGYRAIRISLTRRELFRTQLRAIYRASAFGKLSIMYPMIISLDEVRQIRGLVEEVKEQMQEEGIPFDPDVPNGIMIETPAAAIISDILAKEVDFFSIGTNDLSQYTLAVDRQNAALGSFFDPHHEAILRLIELVVKNAHAAGIPVSICGELGADASLTERFLRLGVDKLSVSPIRVLPLREKIRSLHLSGF